MHTAAGLLSVATLGGPVALLHALCPASFSCHSADRVSRLHGILSPSTEPETTKGTQREIHLEVQMAVGHLLKISQSMVPGCVHSLGLPLWGPRCSVKRDCISDGQKQVCRAHVPFLSEYRPALSQHLSTWLTAVPTRDKNSRALQDVLVRLIQNKLNHSSKMLVPVPIYHWRDHTFCLYLLSLCLMPGGLGMIINNSPFYA